MTKRTALFLVVGFVGGCGASAIVPLVVPPAHAQTTTRWEVFCAETDARDSEGTASAVMTVGNRAGAEGWELVSAPGNLYAHYSIACFKRPAP